MFFFVYNKIAGRNTLYTRVIELTFKRYLISSTTRPPTRVVFLLGSEKLNIYVYSDESGVFDRIHNEYFVFGGVVFLSTEEKENRNRMYLSVEKQIRRSEKISKDKEVKATSISNKGKGSLYRSLNNVYKFGAVIDQKRILPEIFDDKKSKQRYLDYAYKIAIKRFFQDLIAKGVIKPKEIDNIYFFIDEHSTATNGKYELREALEEEFKRGTFNFRYDVFYPPIFPNLQSLTVTFCNSSSKTLIRAADIVANRLYHKTVSQKGELSTLPENFKVTYLPEIYKTTLR